MRFAMQTCASATQQDCQAALMEAAAAFHTSRGTYREMSTHLEGLVTKEVDVREPIGLHKLQAVCLVPALQEKFLVSG